LCHIEFLSEESTTGPLFALASSKDTLVTPINKRFVYKEGKLFDMKYGTARSVDGYINVYDSEKGVLIKVGAGDINAYIASLPADRRHWIELVDVPIARDMALRLMPRLKYAL
jgi:hypothetical protein